MVAAMFALTVVHGPLAEAARCSSKYVAALPLELGVQDTGMLVEVLVAGTDIAVGAPGAVATTTKLVALCAFFTLFWTVINPVIAELGT